MLSKRYGRGLHSTRKTKTRQVPGFKFDEFATGRGRGCCQPSLPLLVECHLMRLMLVDSCEEAWRKCAHMSEDVREGRIRTAVQCRCKKW